MIMDSYHDSAKCVASQSEDGKHMLISVAPFLEPHGAVHVPAETLRKLHDQLGEALRESDRESVIPQVRVSQNEDDGKVLPKKASEPDTHKDTVWDGEFQSTNNNKMPAYNEPQLIEISQAASADLACEKKRKLWMSLAISVFVCVIIVSSFAFYLLVSQKATFRKRLDPSAGSTPQNISDANNGST